MTSAETYCACGHDDSDHRFVKVVGGGTAPFCAGCARALVHIKEPGFERSQAPFHELKRP